MINVGIVGGTGKLGRNIIDLLLDHNEISIGAVIARKNSPYIGKDIGFLIDRESTTNINNKITDDIIESSSHCDLYIDCTNVDAFMAENYDLYLLVNKPVIIATTGFNSEELEKISKMGKSMPVVLCPNFSIGVYKFLKLVELAAREFGLTSDIDIFEYHHKYKKDKPSGTALKIVDSINKNCIEPRIELHSVRSGNIIGEHTVMFTSSDNERVEISHKIYSRTGFSKGLIESIKWIEHKEQGIYGISDIFL